MAVSRESYTKQGMGIGEGRALPRGSTWEERPGCVRTRARGRVALLQARPCPAYAAGAALPRTTSTVPVRSAWGIVTWTAGLQVGGEAPLCRRSALRSSDRPVTTRTRWSLPDDAAAHDAGQGALIRRRCETWRNWSADVLRGPVRVVEYSHRLGWVGSSGAVSDPISAG